MKNLYFAISIILAVVAGFFLGRNSVNQKEVPIVSSNTIVRDTIIKEKTVKIYSGQGSEPVTNLESVDSIDVLEDSLLADSRKDTTSEDLTIKREKLLATEKLPIQYLNEDETETIDSLLAESLGVKKEKLKFLTIEYWESPLNFEGYKLSKGKLVLYGISDQFDFELIKNGNFYFLSSDDIAYQFKETDKFEALKIVSNATVYAD